MFNGKMKAVTFSYDDGVTQDRRLVEIFNKYGIKATFNINSELLDTENTLTYGDKSVAHNKISRDELKNLYEGHEVAVHTLTHPMLPSLDEAEIIRQVEKDRENLSSLCGYEVVGMAYPGGGVNFDLRVADIIAKNTGVKYARTTVPTFNFELQKDLYVFNPTVHHKDTENCLKMIDEFLKLETDTPKLLYIWGHSYEFDFSDNWDFAEEMCNRLAFKEDIFYGTNRECFEI
ncbi:MAG: polysaccharide deacetylase family protein [Clostridia bacterium]|nr:polysaccharide deacetylase family protein [Clostridia bacterium]